MDKVRHSIRDAWGAAGNFLSSFRHAPEARLVDPGSLLDKKPDGTSQEKEWTFLVYLDGRHRLAYSTALALNKMEVIGSGPDVNVVAQATVEPRFNERIYSGMEKAPTRRYYIQKDAETDRVTSPVVGELDASVPLSQESLADFLAWGMQQFPAKHYAVVIKKHGLGFAKADPQAPLSARELDAALTQAEQKTGKKADVIAFDSCSMQQMEVAYQIKDHARVMAGSEEDVYAADFPYERVLWGLSQNARTITPENLGRLIVDAHRKAVPNGIQTAVDLGKLGDVGTAMKALVDTVIQEQVPRDVLYTCMMLGSSMEPQESLRLAFNFRDLGGFLQQMATNPAISSPKVKQAAQAALEKVSATILDHHVGESKQRLKDARGYTTYMPFEPGSSQLLEGYGKLAYAQASDWTRLLDYVFKGPDLAVESPTPSVEKLSLTQKLGKAGIGTYKHYVAPFLLVSCRYTPSCSQYAREAIEKHGLVEGGKLAFMRLVSCDGHDHEALDPVPDVGQRAGTPPAVEVPGEILPPAIVAPPPSRQRGAVRQRVERLLFANCRTLGRLAGGTLGAVLAAPVTAVAGAYIGARAGSNTIDSLNASLLERYREASVRSLLDIEHMVGDAGFATHQAVEKHAHSGLAAKVAGTAVGTVAGAAIGLAGGLWKGYSWGALLGGLTLENFAKDKLGELPKNPRNEAILRHDYHHS